ncbi:Rieske 2Fe-2S domain-containing protein [bacterium]|nr:Rieske 2Fe-2S domain-containing protein [candidate division CSSED10-310 bacterium]
MWLKHGSTSPLVAGLVVLVCVAGGCKALTGISDTPEAAAGSFRFDGGQLVVDLGQVTALQATGGSVQIKTALKDTLLVVRIGPDAFRAFANRCSHRSRELEYDAERGELCCVSIGHSRYNLDGLVLKGPAEKPLQSFPCTRRGNELYIDVSSLL